VTERVIIEGAVDAAFQRQVASLADELKRAHDEGARIGSGAIGSSFSQLREQIGEASGRASRFAVGMGEVTAGIAGGAAAAVAAGVAFGRLAAQGDLNARAAAGVAGGYDLVSRATMGTVTALSAYRAQQALVNSGLRVSGEELASVARHAREHRDVTQSAEEAVQELTEALREGEEGGLRKYGIAVQQGATRAQTFESALRQMREAAQGTDPALRTASESMDAMSSGATDAVSALASLASQGLGLNNVVNNLSTDIRRLGDDLTELAARRANAERNASEERERTRLLEDVRQNRANVAQVLREQGMPTDLLPDAGLSLNRLNAQQLTEVAGTIASIRSEVDGLRATNEQTVLEGFARARNSATGVLSSGNLESVATGLGANDAERAVDALRAARRGADPNAAADRRQLLETRLRFLSGQIMEALNPASPRDRAAAPTEPEAAAASAAVTANDNAGPRRPTLEDLMGRAFERSGPDAGQPAPFAGEMDPEQLAATAEKERETRQALADATNRVSPLDALRLRAREGRRDARTASEASLADVRDPAVQAEQAAQRALDTQVERERATSEERLRVQESFTDQWERLHRRQASATTASVDMANSAINKFGESFGKHVNLIISGQESVGEGVLNMVQEVVTGIGQEAIVKAAMSTAEGVAALAGVLTAPLAPGHFAAAGAYAAVGVAALGAGAILGAARGSGGGGAAAGTPATAPALPPPTQQDAEAAGGRNLTIVYGGGILGSPRELARHVRDVLEEGEQAGVRLPSRVVERAA
jgi:hypothetical protein